MEMEKICPYMSRPHDMASTEGFITCQKERCMGWVPEYRIAPSGIVPAHCKLIGLENRM
jgi:hypothetical protein